MLKNLIFKRQLNLKLQKLKKFFVFVLFAGIIISFASAFLSAYHEDNHLHHCHDDHCAACIMLNFWFEALSSVANLTPPHVAFFSLLTLILEIVNYSSLKIKFNYSTLVKLHVRLDD